MLGKGLNYVHLWEGGERRLELEFMMKHRWKKKKNAWGDQDWNQAAKNNVWRLKRTEAES